MLGNRFVMLLALVAVAAIGMTAITTTVSAQNEEAYELPDTADDNADDVCNIKSGMPEIAVQNNEAPKCD